MSTVMPYSSAVMARRSINDRYAQNWWVFLFTTADQCSERMLARSPTYTVATPVS
jgi:hypothetical protein